jgi:hypothetical protein
MKSSSDMIVEPPTSGVGDETPTLVSLYEVNSLNQ